MLLELFIADFAIIDRIRLQFAPAFNVLTGETGAGKSIMIDALGMLRGERADPTFVRAGSTQARVEGIFSLHDRPDLIPILEEYGLYSPDDDQVILSREIHGASGRSVGRINGRAVNSAVLREVGGRLVDIHGQHEGLALFNTRTHGDMLDRYAGTVAQREVVSDLVARLERVRTSIASLRKAESRRVERIEELAYLVEELGTANLVAGEEESLSRERTLMQNAAKITNTVESAYRLLKSGGPSSERRPATRAIVDSLEEATGLIGDLARLDPTLSALNELALDIRYRLDDIITGVRDYRASLDFEPGRLEIIEDRVAELRELSRKYRAADAADLLQKLASAESELETLHHSAEHIADLEHQEAAQLDELGYAAADLSARRRAAGDEMAERIELAMRDLAMLHVKFYVQLGQRPDPHGVQIPASDQRVAFDRTGIDVIEFMLSPNPGEPLKPLARIASGGESARLLLAMKSILSSVDSVPTLVFDEIDVGVGGRSGQVVGEKLWGISDAHQVLCITHLPQIAAFGDQHFAIAKQVANGRTETSVRPLSDDERISEIAAMLDGTPISEASRRSAAEMLERAANHKLSTINDQ
ncbi:MAG: DNA repair protein RecN [Herpetosiphonaceae bacterium]|nr:DNA repair protein RecN [Herpetosiphonaceae bacterium]